MKLSAPIHRLKRRAKRLSRTARIPLHEALDRVAAEEGFRRWSLLTSRTEAHRPAQMLLDQLVPGDLVLVAARPGQGKTLISLQLAVEVLMAGGHAAYFTLEYAEQDVASRLRVIGFEPAEARQSLAIDCSDAISAEYIIARLAGARRGTLVVIDYLQLLDQRRGNPDLSVQVRLLRRFARERGMILVFISQIDRAYDPTAKPFPELGDIRLPNPLDLRLFDKACFLNGGRVQFGAVH